MQASAAAGEVTAADFESMAAALEELRAETKATPGSGLVLLVEDEVLVREVGQRLLQSLGYEVVIAKDGAEGLRIFTERHAELVAVMCDIVMPVLSGADATARMLEGMEAHISRGR